MQNVMFSQRFSISGRPVGADEPVFIIAEIGVNHNGDMTLARKMIDAAAAAGVDAVKFQTFRVDSFMVDEGQLYEYKEGGQTVSESTYAMLKRLELPEAEHEVLFEYARSKGIIPLTSVSEVHSIDVAVNAGAGAFKIASADLTNYPLLRALGKEKKPVLISTGMTTEDEVAEVCSVLGEAGLSDCIFLHCVSLYPTPDSEANIARMMSLKGLTGSLVGYSDHTRGEDACVLAVAMGACVLEKHFTLDKMLPGPDHAFSADPADLQRLVERVRHMELLKGSGAISPGDRESVSRSAYRPSVTAAENLSEGTILAEKHLCLKWPGGGIHPGKMQELIGKVLNRPVKKNDRILWDMLVK